MTHYKTLGIDHNASSDLIEFSYQERLKDAKEKLQNSPLFFDKQKKLEHAYQVLSSPTLRQAYNEKLAKDQSLTNPSHKSVYSADHSNSPTLIGFLGLKFSKGFIVAISIVIIFFIALQYNHFRIAQNRQEQELNYYNQMREKQMLMQQQQMDRYNDSLDAFYEQSNREDHYRYEMDDRSMSIRESNASSRRAIENRRLAMQEERESQRAKYEARRQRDLEQTRKRHAEYEANQLSRENIRRIERTGKLQRDINRLKAGL